MNLTISTYSAGARNLVTTLRGVAAHCDCAGERAPAEPLSAPKRHSALVRNARGGLEIARFATAAEARAECALRTREVPHE